MKRISNQKATIGFGRKGLSFICLVVMLYLMLTPVEGLSQVTVPPGFTVEVLATVEQPTSLAFAPAGSPFGSDLFVGSLAVETISQSENDHIFTISPTGTVTLFVTLLPEADPTALEFPASGSPFGDFLYVSANNRDGSCTGDCGGAIQRVNPSGAVTDFTSVSLSFSSCGAITALGEPSGLAFGLGGVFGTDLFVANSSDCPADIMRVNSSGTAANFVNDGKFSSNATFGLAPLDVEFGSGGDFGSDLYFTDFGEGCQCVRKAASTGSFTAPFVTLPGFAGSLKFAPAGPFGNDLYVTVVAGGSGSIYRVQADGTFSVFATGFVNFSTDALEFSPDGTALYVADFAGNTVYKITKLAVPFAALDAKVEIEEDEFEVKGTFTLGAGSDGIDIPTEIVSLQLSGGSASFSITIPAGAFSQDKKGRFKFEGVIDGVFLEAKITPLGGDTFEFKAEAEGADLTGIGNPVTVTLTVGDDGGSTTIEAEFE